jgi:hypothetical protein
MKRLGWAVATAAAFTAGFMARGVLPGEAVASAQAAAKVYELRTYVVPDDKFAALNARFRNHTMRIFNRHAMTSVGYFIPQDETKAKNTLIYVLQHPSREAADKNWTAFRNDAEWTKVAADSGVGPVMVTREFMTPTDYSPMK